MRSFSQLKVILKQKQLPDVSLILQDTELWTVIKLHPFCFRNFQREKQIKECGVKKTPQPLLSDNCVRANSGLNMFIVAKEKKRQGARARSTITALKSEINHTSCRSSGLVKPSAGNLPAERDFFNSYHFAYSWLWLRQWDWGLPVKWVLLLKLIFTCWRTSSWAAVLSNPV